MCLFVCVHVHSFLQDARSNGTRSVQLQEHARAGNSPAPPPLLHLPQDDALKGTESERKNTKKREGQKRSVKC